MKKNLILGALIAISLMLVAPSLLVALTPAPPTPLTAAELAEQQAKQVKMLEGFKKEAPLSQKDIDTFIKMLPELKKVSNDDSKIAELCKKYGLTKVRGDYVNTKIGVALMLLNVPKAEAVMGQIPDGARPTKDELALVKKNQEAIKKTSQMQ